MIHVGIVGGAMSYHGLTFTSIFNGCDLNKFKETKVVYPGKRILEAKVVKVWDAKRKDAESLARICYVDEVVESFGKMLEEVDAVIIPDDGTMQHQTWARPFLERRIPVFVDKPLSSSIEEAEGIIDTAFENDALLLSCSALRYARELEEAQKDIDAIGPILTGSVIGPGDLVWYGIHPLELVYSVMGPGVESVWNIGTKDCSIVKIGYIDGRTVVLQVFKGIAYVFHMSLYGKNGWKSIVVSDSSYFYWNLMEHFVWMVKNKKNPIPLEQTLEIIKILASSRKSLERREKIPIM